MDNQLRLWMQLCEAAADGDGFEPEEPDDDDGEEEDEPSFDHLPSSRALVQLRPLLAEVAQAVYDWWEQGEHDELNGGGICHLIADKLCDVIGRKNIPISSVSSTFEVHVYCVAQCSDGVFEVDIPYSLYERGGGYTWTKIPDVVFTPDDVYIHKLDGSPENFAQYIDEG